MEPQEQSLFCWCATCVSLIHFYRPGYILSQQAFAKAVFGSAGNRGSHPLLPLRQAGLLQEAISGSLSLPRLRQELDAGRPVVIVFRYFVGSHMAVLSGYEGSLVKVNDPMHGDRWYAYHTLLQHYRDTGYSWAESYTTKPPLSTGPLDSAAGHFPEEGS